MRLIIEETPDEVAATVAAMITEELAVPGPATLGLSGGSTPEAAYRTLADSGLDWERITLWLGDERWVPPNHEASNAAMAHRTLGPEASRSLLVVDYSLGDADAAAAKYESDLRKAFIDTGEVPGTVLLGLGEDGHTASLFPASAALSVEDRWYVANRVSADIEWRLTATLPLLSAARHLVFIVTGPAKARVVAEILDWSVAYPARRVLDRAAGTTWVLDAAAASRLKRAPS